MAADMSTCEHSQSHTRLGSVKDFVTSLTKTPRLATVFGCCLNPNIKGLVVAGFSS